MEISPYCLLSLLPIFLLYGFSLSYDEFDPHAATSRALLQAKTTCREDFATKNYTIITSKCKGPKYPEKLCCSAFKEFACPFAEVINDEKSDCASTMFNYINIYGHYHPGIFANLCKEGKDDGLECTDVTEPASSTSDCTPGASTSATYLALLSTFLLLCISLLSS